MTAELILASGKVAIVDDDLYPQLSQYKWSAIKGGKNGLWYASRSVLVGPRKGGKRITYYLHREVLGLSKGDGLSVDHINGDGLDNRRANLRVATQQQNRFNQTRSSGASKFKGVCWEPNSGIWKAAIWKDRRIFHLGRFRDERDAALAYNAAAVRMFGDFAHLNEV